VIVEHHADPPLILIALGVPALASGILCPLGSSQVAIEPVLVFNSQGRAFDALRCGRPRDSDSTRIPIDFLFASIVPAISNQTRNA
jgi:hypothetical protein